MLGGGFINQQQVMIHVKEISIGMRIFLILLPVFVTAIIGLLIRRKNRR